MRYIVPIVIALLVVVGLAGCGPSEPADCKQADLATYAAAMDGQLAAFRQQSDLVGASPRMSIGAPLQRLLDIQTETRKIVAPGCVADYHARTIRVMELYQITYQGFAAQQISNEIAGIALNEAKQQLNTQVNGLALVRVGTVPPTPAPPPAATLPPTPAILSTPVAAVAPGVRVMALVAGGPRDGSRLCADDRVQILARLVVENRPWVQVEVAAQSDSTCISRAPVGTQGWLQASEVQE